MQTIRVDLLVMPASFTRFLLLVLLGLPACFSPCLAQPTVDRVLVSDSLLRRHVYHLAADSLQGRRTGTVGQQKAVAYCLRAFRASHLFAAFRADSLRSSYRQNFPIRFTSMAYYGSMPGLYASQPYRSSYQQAELINKPMSRRDSSRAMFGVNMGGLIPGTDLKQEIIMLSAHYDHLGATGKRIFHGADDNASGTAAVLSVAAVFDSLARAGVHSRRTVLFVLFSGEEDGLLGSAYFVNHPPADLNRIVCGINVDMIGRVDDAHLSRPDYCYLITNRRGDELKRVIEGVNAQRVGLQLNQGGYDTTEDPDCHFRRSDQYNLSLAGIPALLMTSGEHADYHSTTDTAEKIHYDALQKRATLLFQTAWTLANPAP